METEEDLLQNCQRLLDSYGADKLLLETRKEDMDRNEVHNAKAFNQLKSQYTDLKYNLQNNQTRLFFLDGLENNIDGGSAETAKELKASTKKVQKIKENQLDQKLQREEWADAVDTMYPPYVELQCQLKDAVENLKSKKKASTGQEENPCKKNTAMSEKVSEIQAKLEALKDREAAAKHELEEKKAKLEDLLEKEKEVKEDVHVQSTQEQRRGVVCEKSVNWYKDTCHLLSTLCGVRVKSSSANSFVIEFLPSDEGSRTDEAPLEMTVSTMEDTLLGTRMRDIKLSQSTIEAEDIIETSLNHNDVSFLVTGIRDRWLHHCPLVTEVDNLRDRFALDWVASEGKVTVIYGKTTIHVATLYIEPGYPATGKVCLQSVTGLPDNITVEELKPTQERASLTEWLDFLHNRLLTAS